MRQQRFLMGRCVQMSERSFEDELRLASRAGDAAAAPSASGAALTAGLNLEEMVAGSEAAFSALLSVRSIPTAFARANLCVGDAC